MQWIRMEKPSKTIDSNHSQHCQGQHCDCFSPTLQSIPSQKWLNWWNLLITAIIKRNNWYLLQCRLLLRAEFYHRILLNHWLFKFNTFFWKISDWWDVLDEYKSPGLFQSNRVKAFPMLTPFGISSALALVQAQAALQSIKPFWLSAGIPGFPGTGKGGELSLSL